MPYELVSKLGHWWGEYSLEHKKEEDAVRIKSKWYSAYATVGKQLHAAICCVVCHRGMCIGMMSTSLELNLPEFLERLIRHDTIRHDMTWERLIWTMMYMRTTVRMRMRMRLKTEELSWTERYKLICMAIHSSVNWNAWFHGLRFTSTQKKCTALCTSFATSTDTHNFISPPVNTVEFYYQHDNNAFPLTSFSSFPLYHHFLPSFLPSFPPLFFLLSFLFVFLYLSLYLFNLSVNTSQISQALYNWDELRSLRATRAWRYDIPRKTRTRKLPSRWALIVFSSVDR